MRKLLLSLLLVCCVSIAVSVSSEALIINPDPLSFADDNGSELFYPSNSVFSIELLDLGSYVGFPSSFGFYFASNPSALISIFEPEDSGGSDQLALVDFVAGEVADLDEGIVQDTFTPGLGAIGFFYEIDATAAGGPQIVLFTQTSRNNGSDVSATFPSFTEENLHVLGFELFDDDTQMFETVSYNLVGNIDPVPEPSTLMLLCMGFIGIWFVKRKSLS